MSTIVQKARELGMLIAQSEEIKRFHAAEEKHNADPEAQRLLAQYQKKRADITDRMRGGQMTPETMKGFQAEIKAAMDELTENDVVREYLEAKGAFNQLVTQVNSVISYCIKGEESEEGGCSGSCEGCHGCSH